MRTFFNVFANILWSPLDQFDTYTVCVYIHNFEFKNPLTFTIIVCYCSLIAYLFIYKLLSIKKWTTFNYLMGCIFNLTKEIVQPIKIRRKQFLSFSTFILTKNSYSQLPASKAITATMQLPFCYSISFCIAFNLLFLLRHKPIEALSFFIPAAIPLEMAPFLWIIELISHLIKVISLAVRLCANIFSGHVSLDTILTALFLILVKGGAALFIVFLIFQLIGFAIQLLETFIGFLQAFVFLTLTSIYTAEIFGGDH